MFCPLLIYPFNETPGASTLVVDMKDCQKVEGSSFLDYKYVDSNGKTIFIALCEDSDDEDDEDGICMLYGRRVLNNK